MMTIRYNAFPRTSYKVPPVNSGYKGNVATGITIPPVGLTDVDRALFNLFEKEISMFVETDKEPAKVPVILAAGEKWVQLKKQQALRDRNGTLILPLISIIRTTVAQTPNEDIAGRGINQQTGELIIGRRLDESDRTYQSLINRLLIDNQSNIANGSGDLMLSPIVSRETGDLADELNVSEGGFLKGDKRRNICEFLVVPTPQFFTATYEITLWSQYVQQMNQMIEALLASFLPQGIQNWKITTDAGYWFIATADGTFTPQNNFEDMSSDERMIKYDFSIKVQAYAFANSPIGKPIPVRKFVSAPKIEFAVATQPSEAVSKNSVDDPFLGSDDPTLPLDLQNKRDDRRNDGSTLLYPDSPNVANETDKALRSREPAKYSKITALNSKGQVVVKYLKIQKTNPTTGEVVYAPSNDLGGLTVISVDD